MKKIINIQKKPLQHYWYHFWDTHTLYSYDKMKPHTILPPPARRHRQDKRVLPPPLQCVVAGGWPLHVLWKFRRLCVCTIDTACRHLAYNIWLYYMIMSNDYYHYYIIFPMWELRISRWNFNDDQIECHRHNSNNNTLVVYSFTSCRGISGDFRSRITAQNVLANNNNNNCMRLVITGEGMWGKSVGACVCVWVCVCVCDFVCVRERQWSMIYTSAAPARHATRDLLSNAFSALDFSRVGINYFRF